LWPAGIVGSITHCDGYRACAVAPADAVLALGIDAERDAPLSEGVWAEVAFGSELALRAPTASGPHLDAVLFSAKESVYKAWFPLTRRRLGFADAEITIAVDGTFRARLPAPGAPLTQLAGRWAAGGGVVVTAIAIERQGF
jgi:4'-phosphopantetheinyl transferase EntD